MVPEKTWSSRKNILDSLCVGDADYYRLGIDSSTHGVTYIQGSFRNLINLLLQLPTKNKYSYEKVSSLAE